MISGETQALIEDHFLDNDYDDFFGSKKKRQERKTKRKAKRVARRLTRNSSAKIQERKEKRSRFFKDVGQIYQDIGGATAIGGVVDAILMPKYTQNNTTQNNSEPDVSDYEVSLGGTEDREEAKNFKKGIPTIAYVVGGVVVVGIIGLLILQNKRRPKIQAFSQ